ncbi:MAG TPA: hypothetical protein VFR02_10545 [bacterium]|nr:hypothetical protein [bacterium]
MSFRPLAILLGAFLLALEPALPPAPMGHIQPQDRGLSQPVKGLCGLPACRPHKPSLCGRPPAPGLYASGCVPVNKGFYAPPATAKWASRDRVFFPVRSARLNPAVRPLPHPFQAEPIPPPPRA